MKKNKTIDLEKIFLQVAKEVKGDDDLIKQEFLAEIKILAEKWIENKYAKIEKK